MEPALSQNQEAAGEGSGEVSSLSMLCQMARPSPAVDCLWGECVWHVQAAHINILLKEKRKPPNIQLQTAAHGTRLQLLSKYAQGRPPIDEQRETSFLSPHPQDHPPSSGYLQTPPCCLSRILLGPSQEGHWAGQRNQHKWILLLTCCELLSLSRICREHGAFWASLCLVSFLMTVPEKQGEQDVVTSAYFIPDSGSCSEGPWLWIGGDKARPLSTCPVFFAGQRSPTCGSFPAAVTGESREPVLQKKHSQGAGPAVDPASDPRLQAHLQIHPTVSPISRPSAGMRTGALKGLQSHLSSGAPNCSHPRHKDTVSAVCLAG